MASIDALALAIKEFEGGVVIVSHDFRMTLPLSLGVLSLIVCPLGLISQVAEELWEVADKKIKNLTKSDITIVDYKKNLVKQSVFLSLLGFSVIIFTFLGHAAIEKAKLFSKTAPKRKT